MGRVTNRNGIIIGLIKSLTISTRNIVMVVLAASNYDDKVDGKKDQAGSKQDIY